MNTLQSYVTPLRDYLNSLSGDEVKDFAERADTTPGYISQLKLGYKKIGPTFALTLEKASQGKLKAEILCPDFPWHEARSRACPNCDD